MLKFNVLKDKISFKYIMVPRYSGIDKNRSCKKLFNIVLWNLFVIFKCTLFIINLYFLRYLGYVWFLENTKEKKNVKENDFFMFGCFMKNIKEN